jgi:hypothetical protein
MKNVYLTTPSAKKIFRNILLGLSLVAAEQQAAVAQTYCTPTYSTGCSVGDDIRDVILNGALSTMISNLNNPCPAGGYQDYTTSTAPNMTTTLIMGNTYNGNVTTNYQYGNESVKVWIDFNNNGTFETTEVVATLNNINNLSTGAITVAVPLTASAGVRRMRVRLVYTSTATGIDPCTSATWGECHDYKVTIMPPAPPDNAGVTSLVTPNSTPFCSNSTREVSVSVKNLGSNTLNTANVNWSVNGTLQTPVTLPASLANYLDSAVVVLGNVTFPTTAPLQIKAWTSMPNGVADTKPVDDTLTTSAAASLQGVDVNIKPGDTTICQGNSIVLNADTFPLNPIYIWSTGSLAQTIDVTQAGTYAVKVQNTLGCYDRDTVIVTVHPNPLVNSIAIIDNGSNTFTFNVIGAQNISNWEWNFGDGTAPVSGTGLPGQQIHQYTTAGEFTVTLTLSNDCNEIVTTRLIKIDATTGIDNVSALQKELKLYPNPGKSQVTVSSYNGTLKLKNVAVYNLMGQQVYESAASADKHQLDVSSMAAGIYNVIITTDKGKATKKLEVIK